MYFSFFRTFISTLKKATLTFYKLLGKRICLVDKQIRFLITYNITLIPLGIVDAWLNSQVNKSTAIVRKTGIICYDRSHLLLDTSVYYWDTSAKRTNRPKVRPHNSKWPWIKLAAIVFCLIFQKEPEGAKLFLFYSFFFSWKAANNL
jgi:hypothetical protein